MSDYIFHLPHWYRETNVQTWENDAPERADAVRLARERRLFRIVAEAFVGSTQGGAV